MNKVLNQVFILCIYLFLFVTIIFLVLIPRGVSFYAQEYHMERSYFMDWSIYIENISHFFHNLFVEKNLGVNIYNNSVWEDIVLYFFERSLPVIVGGFLLTLFLGALIGTTLFVFGGKKSGRIISVFVWIVQSVPDFFLYILIQVTLFQLFRWGIPSFSVYSYDQWYSYIIAIAILAIFPSAYLASLIYPALEDESEKKYMQTAQSKGITPFIIVMKHQWMNIGNKISNHIHTVMLIIIGNLIIFEYLFFMRGAAMRTYLALGFHNATIRGSYRSMVSDAHFETHVIIWLCACFLITIYITHLIQTLLSDYFSRRMEQ